MLQWISWNQPNKDVYHTINILQLHLKEFVIFFWKTHFWYWDWDLHLSLIVLFRRKPKRCMKLFERTNWKALWQHTTHCVTSQTSRGKPRGKLSMEGVQIFCQIFHILIKRQSHAYRSEGWAALAEREQLWKDEFYLKKRRGSSGESSGAKYSTIADCRRARLWNILSLSSASSPSFQLCLCFFFFSWLLSVAYDGCCVEVLCDRTQ